VVHFSTVIWYTFQPLYTIQSKFKDCPHYNYKKVPIEHTNNLNYNIKHIVNNITTSLCAINNYILKLLIARNLL